MNGWYEWVIAGLAPDAGTGFLGPAGLMMAFLAAWLIFRQGPADLLALLRRGWHRDTPSQSG